MVLDGRVLEDPAAGIRLPPEDRRVGAVFQDVLLFPHMTVAENVAFGVREAHRSEADRIARTWLERVGLDHLAAARPDRISGGEAQRAGLARALAGEPSLLLLDEPLSALDVGARAGLRRFLGEHLSGFGGPRLLITHDPAEAFLLADRIVVVEDGNVTQAGTPEEIRRSPRTRYAADLAGLNLLAGTADSGTVRVGDGPDLTIGDTSVSGPVLLTIHPHAISIHPDRPAGSARNVWRASIAGVEPLGDLCRVQFGAPHPLTAEITAASRRDLGLEPGREAWLSIKATEIVAQPG
jgi:molybdate transport system ATP-binding protein